MRKPYLIFPVFIAAALCLVFLVSDWSLGHSPGAIAQEQDSQEESDEEATEQYVGEDTQILQFTSMIELQTYMKGVAEALGVDCKFCHNIRNFAENVEGLHKEDARRMMRMVQDINSNHLQDYSRKVTCFTCHRGHEHPPETKEQWEEHQHEHEDSEQ